MYKKYLRVTNKQNLQGFGTDVGMKGKTGEEQKS